MSAPRPAPGDEAPVSAPRRGRSRSDAAVGRADSRRRDPNRPWYAYAASLLPTETGRWIDFGAGLGEFGVHAARAGRAAPIALDRNTEGTRAARRAGPASIRADLEGRLPIADARLDGASLIEVIEHIPEAEGLVDELARVIRTGGWLIVTTPNVAHLTYRIRALTGHPPKQEGYHYRFFTEETLRRCLETRGFRIEARASFGKQALLTKLFRLAGRGAKYKFRYRVPGVAEALLAQHFVWRLRRITTDANPEVR